MSDYSGATSLPFSGWCPQLAGSGVLFLFLSFSAAGLCACLSFAFPACSLPPHTPWLPPSKPCLSFNTSVTLCNFLDLPVSSFLCEMTVLAPL